MINPTFVFHGFSQESSPSYLGFSLTPAQPSQLVAVTGIRHGFQQLPLELVHGGIPLLNTEREAMEISSVMQTMAVFSIS